MPENVYSVLSMGMRYWFILLGLLIVWRAFHWLRRDRKEKHRRLKSLPDAGMVGEMAILAGSEELPAGSAVPVPREGVLGALRTCDIVTTCEGVADQHLDFVYVERKGLRIEPRRGRSFSVNGTAYNRSNWKDCPPMRHGDVLEVGTCAMRLRLFAGLDIDPVVVRRAELIPEENADSMSGWNEEPSGTLRGAEEYSSPYPADQQTTAPGDRQPGGAEPHPPLGGVSQSAFNAPSAKTKKHRLRDVWQQRKGDRQV